MSLNIIEKAKLNRQLAGVQKRIQVAEGYLSGIPISTARIGSAIITTAKIEDGAITSGKIANATIENAKINDLNASKITTGYLSADRIAANSIVASKLSVSTLSSIVANVGSINAGTISGVTMVGPTIRTASSGSRVEITSSPEAMTVYDGSNKRVELGNGSIILYGSNSVRMYDGGNLFCQFSASSTSMNLVTTSDSGGLYIDNNAGGEIYIQADDVVNFITPTFHIGANTKTAIVPTSKGFNALYCIESPDVLFLDFYENKKDKLFSEVISGNEFEFDCINGKKLLIGKRKGFEDTRFEKKSELDFERNNKFYAS